MLCIRTPGSRPSNCMDLLGARSNPSSLLGVATKQEERDELDFSDSSMRPKRRYYFSVPCHATKTRQGYLSGENCRSIPLVNAGNKNPPQNVGKPNIATYGRKHTLVPSGIYFRNEKNQYGIYATLIEWRTKPIISLIGIESIWKSPNFL